MTWQSVAVLLSVPYILRLDLLDCSCCQSSTLWKALLQFSQHLGCITVHPCLHLNRLYWLFAGPVGHFGEGLPM